MKNWKTLRFAPPRRAVFAITAQRQRTPARKPEASRKPLILDPAGEMKKNPPEGSYRETSGPSWCSGRGVSGAHGAPPLKNFRA